MAEAIAALTREDRALLTLSQASFPLLPRPFSALAEKVGLSEAAVIDRCYALKLAGLIRRIGPVFEPGALGLATELMAAEVAPHQLEAVGAMVSEWEPVTHCYAREHRCNLWFTTVTPSPDWNARAAARLAARDGVAAVQRLPALRRFKIAVQFDLMGGSEEANASPFPQSSPAERTDPSPVDRELLRVLDMDLPLAPEPFAILAGFLRTDGDVLLDVVKRWQADGRIRRYGALLNHRQLGFTANAMTVWSVPEPRVEEVGRVLASSRRVTHCYQRPAFAGFPYNLYAMIHGREREECLAVAEELSQACGISARAVLFSTREFKKSPPDYAKLLAGSR